MSLPIDPSQIDPADYGEHQTVLEMDHDEAIEHVREVCLDVGFGVPVEFSPSELLNEKVDADRDPYYVLGACNPAVADRVLDVSKEMGGLFPCNMVIWEEAPGQQRVYHVSIMKIARLLGIVPDDDEMQAIVDDTGEMVAETFERLEAA
ncbi:hypothetical protein L593_01895 [Salinarchaeum sp. Harcht-Bsk1]|uniref:DUF302 domain-containing protein n=1 Tax=Salinarchaeum sp. Harcht-Bsk1 TaxID=1333523 RepID=UPI0003424234|nr:DUF302 domain-containing protein [Salinarchaeum sp. Harcht-Bsk1]AGN00330.1 hypothetical protein L593_01895 [Salinarchaeum sp. Harcht-Bsk1]